MAFVARDTGSSAARRRRECRLRSWLRHERMTVRMELAAALHHSSFRRAGPETYDAPRSQMTANSREDSVYFDLYDEDTEGAWPDRLVGVRPQERDQRHTVEQIVDTALIVPSLDVPVQRVDNQLVEVCRQLDVHILEQVIEVPKSHLHPVIAGAVCASLSRRQNSWWKCRRSSPILLCCSGLWSRTSLLQFLVVGETSVFKVFLPDRVLQRSLPLRNAVLSGLWSRSLILVCLVEAFKIFAQSRVPQRLLRVLVNTLVKGFFFGLFPELKEVRSQVRTRGRN